MTELLCLFFFSINNINQPFEEEWSTFWVPWGIFPYIQPALEMRRLWHYTGNKSLYNSTTFTIYNPAYPAYYFIQGKSPSFVAVKV